MNVEINKALELWVDITGVNPNDSRIRLRDMDVERANEVLKQSLVYDDTYVTTLMLLNPYLHDFMEDRMVSLKEIVEDYDTVYAWLQKIREFKGIVQSEEAEEMKSDFREWLKGAVAHYKMDEALTNSVIDSESAIAELRYSAFHALTKLEVVQFSHGQPSGKKPIIYDHIYRFEDVNTLLRWMMSVESGIVLALIQDPADLSSSYFVFAIRNGGTLTLVTDREKTEHPLESMLSRTRSRGRDFYNRITSYYFPYSVMDINFGDNARAYISSDSLAPALQEDGIGMKGIKEVEAEEIIWLIMMFSLLEKKFFQENYQTPELSYTAQMMKESSLLLTHAEERGIAVIGYQPLVVSDIEHSDMDSEKLKEEKVFRYEPTGENDWMVERYGVPEEAFHVLNHDAKQLLLTDGGASQNELAVAVKKMNLSDFGSPEKLEKDRKYLARYNQAQAINVQLKDEYDKRKDEVRDWYITSVRKNLPKLLKAIAEGKFIVSGDHEQASIRCGDWTRPNKDGNILRVGMLEGDGGYWNVPVIGGASTGYNKQTCVLNDTSASLVGHFHPTSSIMLADLCGCKVEELHELLQHWNTEREYIGNPILSSVDPLDWAIRNPWKKVSFDVRVYLSKKAYNQLCKMHGTGNESIWLKNKEGVRS